MTDIESNETTLIVRRRIRAPADRLFGYWTEPGHLTQWWGPAGVTCESATVDLRVGGAYRIANRLPDGNVLWISGEFELVDRPRRLVYTWHVGPESEPATGGTPERVSVTFTPAGDATDVEVVHERIADPAARRGHESGWVGCFEGLERYSTVE